MSLVVKDRDGKVLHEVAAANSLGELDLRRADLSGQNLEGAILDDSDLSEADLTGADLYWAYAFRTKFDNAILKKTNLAGATLQEASFRGADMREAYISEDNLGGFPSLSGADLTGALLDGANLTGCEYDGATRFPQGFDPVGRGMTLVDQNRIYVRPGSFASAQLKPGYYVPDPENPRSYIPVPDKNKEAGSED